ncbi:MAG TPA: DUF4351 domain-containing protein [Blastocatellia bacterium]
MPIESDILENKVLGREFKRGVQEGELTILRRLLRIRFGVLPDWADARLANSSSSDLELFGARLLDSKLSLEEVLEVPVT